MKLTHKVVNTEGRQWRPSMWIIYIVEGEFKTNSIAAAVFKQQKHSHQTFWECGRITLKFIWRILLKEPMKSLKKKQNQNGEWVLALPYFRIHFFFFTLFFLFILLCIFLQTWYRWLTCHRILFRTIFSKYDWGNGFMFGKKIKFLNLYRSIK